MQTGLKQALLRVRSRARSTVPKSRAGEVTPKKWQHSFYSLGEVKSLRYYGALG
jgi:hypothetical protein